LANPRTPRGLPPPPTEGEPGEKKNKKVEKKKI